MHMPYVLTKYIYQGVRNQKSQKWTVPLHPLMHKAQCGPSALNIIHQNMTEIGSFENQTVMKTHVFGIFKGGQYFGNVILNFSMQSEFFGSHTIL